MVVVVGSKVLVVVGGVVVFVVVGGGDLDVVVVLGCTVLGWVSAVGAGTQHLSAPDPTHLPRLVDSDAGAQTALAASAAP